MVSSTVVSKYESENDCAVGSGFMMTASPMVWSSRARDERDEALEVGCGWYEAASVAKPLASASFARVVGWFSGDVESWSGEVVLRVMLGAHTRAPLGSRGVRSSLVIGSS